MTSHQTLFSRQIKRHCAEPFTEYWTCIDYSGLQLFRHCRKQQAKFDECVLDKLGWVRPDLGELSKVTPFPAGLSLGVGKGRSVSTDLCGKSRLIREWSSTIQKGVYLMEIVLDISQPVQICL